MDNPFDDPNGTFHVLTNIEGQHSLWPTFADIPTGWTIALANVDRQRCIDYIEKNWTDMRPLTLVRKTEQSQPNLSNLDRSSEPTETGRAEARN
ncbi:MbtH family protein [Pseudonocardia acaciae]|uniref:MbtH family protein n=1 Tax=Pseudonocardia acaciae TaxID=551276 RepID=UPI000A01029D|nr:MbtH family protein [Pseudonocardia acaciae]